MGASNYIFSRDEFLDFIVYELYPRSFLDSNGDGIGDLNGIFEKLDYLQELGVNAVWLCPIYKSPNKDNGYDVADYREIAKEFGSFADFKRLRDGLHARGMKLIMDLVFNHTSSEHTWFQQAKTDRNNPYHDYYIWADTPPNDWKSCFGGSAWEYNEATKEYYLHSFAIEQPDLNWENPSVRKECQKIVDFWMQQGVDGFRCDVLDFISKDFKTGKMYAGPRLHEYIHELFGRRETEKLFTVGECQSSDKEMLLIAGKERKELSTVFQFDHINLIGLNKYLPHAFTLEEVKNVLVKWQNFTQENDLIYTLFTDNHDQSYFLSKTGYGADYRYECATMLATMFYLLRGIPFLYQGQEYGAVNPVYSSIEDFRDVEAMRYYNEHKNTESSKQIVSALNQGGRDNARRPIAWTKNKANAHGFSQGTPWIPLHSCAEEINLERDKHAEKSVWEFYRKLLALRKSSTVIRRGSFCDLTENRQGCFLYERALGEKKVIVICNFENRQTLLLPNALQQNTFRIILTNHADTLPFSKDFRPFEIAVYESL